MKPMFLPLALVAFFVSGCYSMSKYQCPPSERWITVRNWTFGEIGIEGEVIPKTTLNYDDSITIVQHATNGVIAPTTITVSWGDRMQIFSYPEESSSDYYYGKNIRLDLIESDDSEKLEHCCP